MRYTYNNKTTRRQHFYNSTIQIMGIEEISHYVSNNYYRLIMNYTSHEW